jgi:periplasmic protein TonB
MRCNHALSSAAVAALIALTSTAFGAGPSAASSQVPGSWTLPPPSIEVSGESANWEQSLAVILPVQAEAPPAPRFVAYSEELPVCVSQVAPEYPTLAREADISGQVVTHLLVGADGRVHDVRVDPQHSVMMLEDAATQAAREFVFIPALVNDRPVAVWVAVPFNFRLW